MAAKQTLKRVKDPSYSILETGSTMLRSLYHVAGVSDAVLNALVNGQRDVYTKRLYILKTLLSRSPFEKHVK